MYPILFHVGSFPVHSWGILLMLGFLFATWRALANAPRYKLKAEDVWDVALVGLLGGVIGARLVFVALNWNPHIESMGQMVPGYRDNPGQILAVWAGGMTSFGGFGGGLLAGILLCRAKKINVGDMCDLIAMSFPIGYGLGRIGCFLNGCCYGGACTLPWAVRFHEPDGSLTPPSHPAQLYSALVAVAMYFLLLPLEKGRRFRGQIMLAFLFLYGIYRFFIEFFREGVTGTVTGFEHLTQAQIASLILALAAAVIYVMLRIRQGRRSLPQMAE